MSRYESITGTQKELNAYRDLIGAKRRLAAFMIIILAFTIIAFYKGESFVAAMGVLYLVGMRIDNDTLATSMIYVDILHEYTHWRKHEEKDKAANR